MNLRDNSFIVIIRKKGDDNNTINLNVYSYTFIKVLFIIVVTKFVFIYIKMKIIETIKLLKTYCENNDFKGNDVGDSIASTLITKTFLQKIPLARLVIGKLTGHRIGYVNIRPLLKIPVFYNAKGIALFLNGYCNLYEYLKKHNNHGDTFTIDDCYDKIIYLSDLLLSLRHKANKEYGWGYPTGWQGGFAFFFPANTPTVVASSFVVDALLHSYEITKVEKYKDIALETKKFVLQDLHKSKIKNGFFFSYSQYDGNDTVINASLLGARILMQCYKYTNDVELKQIAKEAIDTCIAEQKEDGSWLYGLGKRQTWIDNFHTGYNLEAIQFYKDVTGESIYDESLNKGLAFMINNHFDENHVPKYFHNRQYPIDIHCCGEIFVILNKLNAFKDNEKLADDVFQWTVENMFNKKEGYFYFQKHKLFTNKASLMRWSNAFMFNALSYYLLSKSKANENSSNA